MIRSARVCSSRWPRTMLCRPAVRVHEAPLVQTHAPRLPAVRAVFVPPSILCQKLSLLAVAAYMRTHRVYEPALAVVMLQVALPVGLPLVLVPVPAGVQM